MALIPVGLLGYFSYQNGRASIRDITASNLTTINLLKRSEQTRRIGENRKSLEALA